MVLFSLVDRQKLVRQMQNTSIFFKLMEKHRKYADINEKTILAEKMLKTLKVLVIFYGNTFH